MRKSRALLALLVAGMLLLPFLPTFATTGTPAVEVVAVTEDKEDTATITLPAVEEEEPEVQEVAVVEEAPAVETDLAGDGMNSLSYNGLLPGDIIVLGTPNTIFDYLIPGEFSHTEVYCGLVTTANTIWDRDYHQWMPVGTPYVIHATKDSNSGNGLGYSRFSFAVNEHSETAIALRVNGLTDAQRAAAVTWMKGQLNDITGQVIGPEYDWGWTCKQLNKNIQNGLSGVYGFYCSELPWAAYKTLYGIDLDPDGDAWSWSTAYGVSPADLYYDGDVTVVVTSDWNPNDCYYVDVWLEGIYYEDDYDPWPKGQGEEYYKYFIGDGLGGSGYKTGDNRGSYVGRDGAGYIYWQRYMEGSAGWHLLIPKTHPLKIRIEAWEVDDWPDTDDQYGAFNWWENNMFNYANQGWFYWDYTDMGACRYCVYFRISTTA